jgi:Uma2 family endonuclease
LKADSNTVKSAPVWRRKTMKNMVATVPVIYPESDGKPMGETGIHSKVIMAIIYFLDTYFEDDPQVYVTGNMFLYYEQGNPGACCCPDVFLSRGIGKEERRTYKVWEEGKPPDLIIELTSKSSRFDDLGTKKAIYQELGVQEYFVFDPLNEYLKPRLMGFRLEEGSYVPMEPSRGRLKSDVTQLELVIQGRYLRFLDPSTGKLVPTYSETYKAEREARRALKREEEARKREEEARKKEEEARKREEDARKREEEARKKEEEARKREEEARKREEEARKKEEEARKREEEARRAAEAKAEQQAAEIERLRAELKRLSK